VLLMAIFLPLLLTRFVFKVKVGWTQ
jgi:iron(III) transport system permease protein